MAQRGFEIRLIRCRLRRSKPESEAADKACPERGRGEYPPHIKASASLRLTRQPRGLSPHLGYTAANPTGLPDFDHQRWLKTTTLVESGHRSPVNRDWSPLPRPQLPA